MGTAVSKQDIESTTKLVSEAMTHAITKIENKSSTYTSSDQYMRVTIQNANINCGNITVSQRAVVTIQNILDNKSDIANEMITELTDELTEKITNDVEHKLKGINIGSTSVSEATNKATSIIQQELNTIIENSISNTISTTTENKQVMFFDLVDSTLKCPSSGKLVIDQDATITAISQNISAALLDNISDSILDKKMIKDVQNKQKTEMEGVNLAAILAIVAFVFALFLVGYFMQSPEEKQMMLNAATSMSATSQTNKLTAYTQETDRIKQKSNNKIAEINAKRGGDPTQFEKDDYDGQSETKKKIILGGVGIVGFCGILWGRNYYLDGICKKYELNKKDCKKAKSKSLSFN
jgi:hypothetical protein